MVFRKDKQTPTPAGTKPVLRGRSDQGEAPEKQNPLARRFQTDGEPDTIDLDQPGQFHAVSDAAAVEPDTRAPGQGDDSPPRQEHPPLPSLLTIDPGTGKFHVHPGPEGVAVLLDDEPVRSATELRRGDLIRIGDAEFRFLL